MCLLSSQGSIWLVVPDTIGHSVIRNILEYNHYENTAKSNIIFLIEELLMICESILMIC